MGYITQQDLIDEVSEQTLIELTDDNETGEIDGDVVSKAILYAEGVFEGYVRTRYSLPVPATAAVKSCCVNIAAYRLYTRRATFADEGTYKIKKTVYDETITLLKDLSSGKAALDIPAAVETVNTPATSDRILTNGSKAKFTDSKLSGF